jgi:uncharacterized protein YjdB
MAGIGGVTGTAQVAVTVPVADVSASPRSATLRTGESMQLTAVASDRYGGPMPDRTVSWTSSNPGVAAIRADGQLTALARGSALVAAQVEGRQSHVPVSVLARVATVALNIANAPLVVVQATAVVATPRDAQGNTLWGRA